MFLAINDDDDSNADEIRATTLIENLPYTYRYKEDAYRERIVRSTFILLFIIKLTLLSSRVLHPHIPRPHNPSHRLRLLNNQIITPRVRRNPIRIMSLLTPQRPNILT